MSKRTIVGSLLAWTVVAASVVACAASVEVNEPRVECRNTVRRRADVEECRTRCGDEGCRTRCVDQERWSREHHCWVE